MPTRTPTMDETAFFHRWLSIFHQEHPELPEAMLEAFFASEGHMTAETLAMACAVPIEAAGVSCRHLEVHLLPPHHYGPVFAAEDALAERRMQWQNYQADAQATNTRLAELQHQIEGTLAYSHLGEQQAAEVKARLEALDQERVDLLRHQGDLPGVGHRIAQALTEARSALEQAEEQRRQAALAQLQDVEDAWLQEALAVLEPVRSHLHQATALDQAWQRLGVKPSFETGSDRLREAVQAALRR